MILEIQSDEHHDLIDRRQRKSRRMTERTADLQKLISAIAELEVRYL
jgi:hypothetical protein